MNDITYVGLDMHKTTICVAIAESGRGDELREVGVFENRPDVLRKMVARLGKHRRRRWLTNSSAPIPNIAAHISDILLRGVRT